MSTLPLLPDSKKPKLIGIARLAAEGESIREGHDVEYFTLPTRSLLNRVVSGRQLPFTWAINPYRGCEFACKYCYARYTHEFMEMSDADFEHKIFVKQHAANLLRQELKHGAMKLRARFWKNSPAIADSSWASSPNRTWWCGTLPCCAKSASTTGSS